MRPRRSFGSTSSRQMRCRAVVAPFVRSAWRRRVGVRSPRHGELLYSNPATMCGVAWHISRASEEHSARRARDGARPVSGL